MSLLMMRSFIERHAQNEDLQYAQPLAKALLKGYQKRFAHLFENNNLLMATALHPSFTPLLLNKIAPEKAEFIKARILRELKVLIRPRQEAQRQPSAISSQIEAVDPQD